MLKSLVLFSFCLIVALFCGCAGSVSKPLVWQEEGVDLVWPAPPDQARVRYLRSLSGPDDFKSEGQKSKMFTWLLGEQLPEAPFVSPYAVAVDSDGVVWVADNGASMLYRYNLKDRRIDYIQEFSEIQLVSPSGVAVDNQRRKVFLADAGLRKIIVLDFAGNYLSSWEPVGGFDRPSGLAVDAAGRLLVADAGSGVVQVFNVDGSLAKTLNSKVNPDGRFIRPLQVAAGPNGEVLILDAFAFQVEIQDAQGGLLGTVGQLGDAAGYLARPRGLAVDQDGHVFISDAAFDNIQVFDMAGNLLMFWGGAGRSPGQFNLPAGLYIDDKGRFFVADSYNHRVQTFELLR